MHAFQQFHQGIMNEYVRRENVLSAMQRALDIIVSLSSVKSLSYWRNVKECMDIRGILEERFLQEAYLCVNRKHPAQFSGQDSSRQGPSQQTKGYRRPGFSIPTPNLSTCRSHTCWDLSRIHLATPSLALDETLKCPLRCRKDYKGDQCVLAPA